VPWTTEQKVFIIEAYFRQKSIHAAQLQFKERFGCHEFPVHSMIYRWLKFRTYGTVHNLNRKDTNRQSHSGRPKSSRTPHAICPGAWQVLDSTWLTERSCQGPPVVPAGWCPCQPHSSTVAAVRDSVVHSLVRGRQRAVCDNQHRAICPGAWQVLDST